MMMSLHDPFMHGLFWTAVVMAGLCLGSMATALVYRLPRGLSVGGRERSCCPSCHTQLKIIDLIPVFSFLFLGGKCRYCRAPIGRQYPIIELMTALLCLLSAHLFGVSWMTVIYCLLSPVIVGMFFIDIEHKILPDILNVSIAVLGASALLATSFITSNPPNFIIEKLPSVLGGVVLYGGSMWGLRFIVSRVLKKEAMGLGDVKLFAVIGLWMGMTDQFAVFLFITGLSGVALALIWKRSKGEEHFPFGPSILLAFLYFLISQNMAVLTI